MGTPTIYHCQEDVRWVKDSEQVVLIAEKQQCYFLLRGLECAVWGWLIMGCQQPQLCQHVSLFLNTTELDARARVIQIMDDWVSKGILRKEEG